MKPVVVRPVAEDDIASAYAWHEKQRAGLGEDFLASVRAGLRDLALHPEAFPIVYPGARRILTHGFPYGIFFRVSEEAIYVLACMHGKRHPKRWRSRIRSEENR